MDQPCNTCWNDCNVGVQWTSLVILAGMTVMLESSEPASSLVILAGMTVMLESSGPAIKQSTCKIAYWTFRAGALRCKYFLLQIVLLRRTYQAILYSHPTCLKILDGCCKEVCRQWLLEYQLKLMFQNILS